VEPAPNIIPTDAIRWYSTDVYGPMLNALQEQEHYIEDRVHLAERPLEVARNPFSTPLERCQNSSADTTLFVFAYDWRKSNSENAQLLAEYIRCIQGIHGEDTGVNILAHSMGGLLTREYIRQNPEDHSIDKVVTVATPWLGSPEAILAIEQGESDFPPVVVTPQVFKALAEFYPGAHQLLPNRTYFRQAAEHDIQTFGEMACNSGERGHFEACDFNHDGHSNNAYTYDQFIEALDRNHEESKPGTTNAEFHAEFEEVHWFAPYDTVDNFHIYGIQSTDQTEGAVTAGAEKVCIIDSGIVSSWNCWQWVPRFYSTDTRGDQTVPLMSALGGEDNIDVHRSKLFYAPTQTDWWSGKEIRNDDAVSHLGLMANPDVIATVIEQLSYEEVPPPPSAIQGNSNGVYFSAFLSQEDTQPELPDPLPAYYVSLTNVSSVTIRDGLGNTTDAISGTFNTPVPNVTYRRMGDVAHDVILPMSQPYTITMPLGPTPAVIQTRTGTGSTTTELIRYRDLTLPLSTTAMLNISPQGVEDLRYDSDGDGTFDTSVEPTVSVSGDNANDTEPPTISIALDEQDGRWLATITAEDDESGVKQVRYSTDDQRYMVYEGPFEVNPDEVTTLYAFADDNVANRSGVAIYDVEGIQGQNQVVTALVIVILTTLVLFLLALPGIVFVLNHTQRRAKAKTRSK
jgi:pimeloyl-ACP methyl ester carboxylesterase